MNRFWPAYQFRDMADWLEGVTWGHGRFVTVGRNGTIAVSP